MVVVDSEKVGRPILLILLRLKDRDLIGSCRIDGQVVMSCVKVGELVTMNE